MEILYGEIFYMDILYVDLYIASISSVPPFFDTENTTQQPRPRGQARPAPRPANRASRVMSHNRLTWPKSH